MRIDTNGHSLECNVASRAYAAAEDDLEMDESQDAYFEKKRCRRLLRVAAKNCPVCSNIARSMLS